MVHRIELQLRKWQTGFGGGGVCRCWPARWGAGVVLMYIPNSKKKISSGLRWACVGQILLKVVGAVP
jgi:hypothetical protein